MASMRVVVAGSSGLVGTALVRRLAADGHDVVSLVRRPASVGELRWDPAAGDLDASAIDGADAVVNLSGAGIGNRRWSDAYRRTLLDSRVGPTRLLAAAIATAPHAPRVFVTASAIGAYGTSPDATFTEASPTGGDFLARLCRAWEDAAAPAAAAGTRVVRIRTGHVLARHGGLLPKLTAPLRWWVGGRYGTGRQWTSWITLDDEVRAIAHLLTSGLGGPVNLTAPNPVTNAELLAAAGEALHRPAWLPVPRPPLRLALGREMADLLLFDGQRVLPAALLADGFEFADPEVGPALHRLLGKEPRP